VKDLKFLNKLECLDKKSRLNISWYNLKVIFKKVYPNIAASNVDDMLINIIKRWRIKLSDETLSFFIF